MNKNFILGIILFFALLYYINYLGGREPTQREIQKLDYAMNKDTIHKNKINDFPYPQISNGFKKLGNNIISEQGSFTHGSGEHLQIL